MDYRNEYGNILEKKILEIVRKRIEKCAPQAADRDDLMQDIVLQLVGAEYEARRSNGATEETFVTAIIENRIKMFYRSRARYERLMDEMCEQAEEPIYDPWESEEWSADVGSVLDVLAPEDREVCIALATGKSQSEIAAERHCHHASVRRAVSRVRKVFEQYGFGVRG